MHWDTRSRTQTLPRKTHIKGRTYWDVCIGALAPVCTHRHVHTGTQALTLNTGTTVPELMHCDAQSGNNTRIGMNALARTHRPSQTRMNALEHTLNAPEYTRTGTRIRTCTRTRTRADTGTQTPRHRPRDTDTGTQPPGHRHGDAPSKTYSAGHTYCRTRTH